MPKPSESPPAPSWVNGNVFSLRLRDGYYALFQMLQKEGGIAVFNHFRGDDCWDDVSLDSSSVLFIAFVLKAFFRRSTIRHVSNIVPVRDLEYPPPETPKISPGTGWRSVTFWPGTPDERTVLVPRASRLSLVSYSRNEQDEPEEQITPIARSDYHKYSNLEMTTLSDYATLNERILLCRLLACNFNPLKEIAFDNPLPIECATYIDLIGGKVRLSDLGY